MGKERANSPGAGVCCRCGVNCTEKDRCSFQAWKQRRTSKISSTTTRIEWVGLTLFYALVCPGCARKKYRARLVGGLLVTLTPVIAGLWAGAVVVPLFAGLLAVGFLWSTFLTYPDSRVAIQVYRRVLAERGFTGFSPFEWIEQSCVEWLP